MKYLILSLKTGTYSYTVTTMTQHEDKMAPLQPKSSSPFRTALTHLPPLTS